MVLLTSEKILGCGCERQMSVLTELKRDLDSVGCTKNTPELQEAKFFNPFCPKLPGLFSNF